MKCRPNPMVMVLVVGFPLLFALRASASPSQFISPGAPHQVSAARILPPWIEDGEVGYSREPSVLPSSVPYQFNLRGCVPFALVDGWGPLKWPEYDAYRDVVFLSKGLIPGKYELHTVAAQCSNGALVDDIGPGTPGPLTGAGPMFPGAQYGAGSNPESVAIGDLNQDGVPDLAVANVNSNNASVLLGQGDGTFASAQNFGAGATPRIASAPGLAVRAQAVQIYGITDNLNPGSLVSLDMATGTATALWTLPSQYTGCDSLVHVDGYFYASYGAFAGGGRIVQFQEQPGTAIDFGQSLTGTGTTVYSIEEITTAPDGTLYVAYNDTDPSSPSAANKIGILTLAPQACVVSFVAQSAHPWFQDLDAIAFDPSGTLWAANLQNPSVWGQISTITGQATSVVGLNEKLIALAYKGRSVNGLQEFFCVQEQVAFGDSTLAVIDELGSIVDIGPIGPAGPSVIGIVAVNDCPDSILYCTGKLNSDGCVPLISLTGLPSLTDPNPAAVEADLIKTLKPGLMIYGYAAAAIPFQDGTLCCLPPLRRTDVQQSGGINGVPCDGAFFFDMNAQIQSGIDPFLVFGAQVNCQYWYRDQGVTSGTGLSDAVQFNVCP